MEGRAIGAEERERPIFVFVCYVRLLDSAQERRAPAPEAAGTGGRRSPRALSCTRGHGTASPSRIEAM